MGVFVLIDYGRIKFAAPPFVGAEWFVRAMQLAGFGPGFSNKAYGLFKENGRSTEELRVTLVRNPLDWIEATYLNTRDCLTCKGNFQAHVRRFIDNPGTVTNLYDQYQADLVLRIEDTPWCLVELLSSCGVNEEHRELVSQTRPRTAHELALVRSSRWTPQLRQLVVEAEKKTMDRYDYWC
jgi:hypothetical protein